MVVITTSTIFHSGTVRTINRSLKFEYNELTNQETDSKAVVAVCLNSESCRTDILSS